MRSAFGEVFDVPAGYLNTAGIGVPPASAATAVTERVARWASGADGPDAVEPHVAAARAAFGRLVGVPADRVAVGASVAQLVALVAASVPEGTSVLVAEGEFTSLTFPFAARGLRITEVPLESIAAEAPRHDLVAVSVVQSADGRVVDLDGLRAAGVPVLLDATQAVGWMPLSLDWADWVVAACYKWLLAPRGAAWLAGRASALDGTRAVTANWYGGEDPWATVYGLPLRSAADARRLDLSPVWLSQYGAAVTLPWLASLDLGAVRDHCVGLADVVRERVGIPLGGSPIVALPVASLPGVRASVRAGRVRIGFHLYNTLEDVQLVLKALE
ncbi:aminotransferase class V-fold PLP-dependent enzyme [Actinosynnema sp. NPDC020468]|uniref:aminotransferase class V-fold PLP-dependent enzyme n=1 Tax=Actinosynnema sp. NPDC020468 TaxID=3154488 RepID=UPI0033CAE0E6